MPDGNGANLSHKDGLALAKRRAGVATERGANEAAPMVAELVSVERIFRALRDKFWLVAICTLTAGSLTALWIREAEPTYRATAVIRLSNERRNLTGEEPDGATERTMSPLLSQIQLLRSRALIGRVVDSLGLRLEPDFEGFKATLLTDVRVDSAAQPDTLHLTFAVDGVGVRGTRGATSAPYGSPIVLDGVRFTIAARPTAEESTWTVVTRETAIDVVLGDLKERPRVATNVVDVTFMARRPAIAQRVVNAIVETFQTASANAERNQSRRRRLFLEEQLNQTDLALQEAQLALSEFRRGAQVYSSKDKLSAQQRDLMTLDVRRAELEADRRMLASLLTAARSDDHETRSAGLRALVSTREIATNPIVAQLHEQLTRYRSARDSLTTGQWRRAETDPDVERLDKLIVSSEEQLINAAASQVASLDARLDALQGLRESNASEIRTLPEMEAEEDRLRQRVESMRRMGDQLREEYQRARMAEAVEVGQVEVVDFAALPYMPVPQMLILKLALGTLLGCLLGGTIAVALDVRNRSIRRREEMGAVLNLPSMGVIPNVVTNRSPLARRRTRQADVAGLMLVTVSDRSTVGVEAYRLLRTNMLFSDDSQRMKTIVITSAAPGEGKTITAANLAVTFARDGRRVLLVDADLRRPRLHRVFGLSRSPGLADVLSGDASLQVYETRIPGLSLLPCGRHTMDPGTLLGNEHMREMLRSLEGHFDRILIDTPPVMAAADAAILGGLVGTVLLVVRAGTTNRDIVQRSLQQLDAVGAHVVGGVLNDPDGETKHEYDAYYAYHADHPEPAAK
jgi:capsular exopolysaccharide synthesis family protein